jgi:hypothetical protein
MGPLSRRLATDERLDDCSAGRRGNGRFPVGDTVVDLTSGTDALFSSLSAVSLCTAAAVLATGIANTSPRRAPSCRGPVGDVRPGGVVSPIITGEALDGVDAACIIVLLLGKLAESRIVGCMTEAKSVGDVEGI